MANEPRITFTQRLNEIKTNLEEMGSTTLMIYENAVGTLFNYDDDVVKEITEKSENIRRMNYLLENISMRTIAAEQPVAKDLRFIESSLKVGAHLRRIGELTVHITEVASYLRDETVPDKPMSDIKKMADLVGKMMDKSLRSFLNEDIKLSKELHRDDNDVDDLFDEALNDITKTMFEDKDAINYMIYLLFLARSLERIADRSESIGNRTIFMLTCEKPGLEELSL